MIRIVLFRTSFLLIIMLIMCSVKSQNYISMHKDEIRTRVGQELSGFAFAKEIYNFDRSFIKFENSFEEQTLIFMLNADGFCTSVSRMYNTWMFNKLKEQLAEEYGKSKNLRWTYRKDRNTYEVELVKGDWFTTVVTRLKKE